MTLQGIRLATQPGLQRAIAPLLARLSETQTLIEQVQAQVGELSSPDLAAYAKTEALNNAIASLNELLDGKANQADLSQLTSSFASHSHSISGIDGLVDALRSKADSGHSHSQYLLASDLDAWKNSAQQFNNFSCTGTFAHKTLNGGKVGFFGQTPSGKPSITGSRQGSAALGSLLRALAALGLVTDNTVG